jgi:S-adenosylmethionine decarboxylase
MRTNFFALFFGCVSLFANTEEYLFQGKHLIASYSECDQEALSDVAKLHDVMLQAAQDCGATVLDSAYYVFPPDGLTMVILLSESHASIHTYPEHRTCFVDLFTCGEKCSNELFDQVLQEYLKPQRVDKKLLLRNESTQDL